MIIYTDEKIKILQLIPAPPGLRAHYVWDDTRASEPVVCLALIEIVGAKGCPPSQDIRPFTLHGGGAELRFPDEDGGFTTLAFTSEPTAHYYEK